MAFRPGIHSSGMPTVTGSIPQDNIIFGMVLLAFVIYITVKNELQTYMGFFSPSKSTSAPAKTTAPSTGSFFQLPSLNFNLPIFGTGGAANPSTGMGGAGN
jgi:hypothetical protein